MNDVFISYAHIDDQPMLEGQRGWISQFHRSLEVRMAQLLGQELKIWRDPKLQSSVAVHLLGRHYGTTPEDAAESVPALQLRWSAESAGARDLPRLIWMPVVGETTDERQKKFLTEVQENPQWHVSADLFEGNLTLLKKDLLQKLSPTEKKPVAPAAAVASVPVAGPARVYLMCEAADEPAVEPLEDFLFDQGLEVCLPAGDGGSADADALHRENLLSCDGVLVFYGSAPRTWVDIKLRDVLKAPGYGRSAPITVQGVYIAPPLDHRKERFRSHQTHVITAQANFSANAELTKFVQALKGARSGESSSFRFRCEDRDVSDRRS